MFKYTCTVTWHMEPGIPCLGNLGVRKHEDARCVRAGACLRVFARVFTRVARCPLIINVDVSRSCTCRFQLMWSGSLAGHIRRGHVVLPSITGCLKRGPVHETFDDASS